MAFKGVFIGINEYRDLAVDNLEGARRDAVALHALFRDSVADVEGILVVDGAATGDEVRRLIAGTLDAAEPDDVVLVTFSGHGSADLGLVLHDSVVSDPASMITMQEIALSFQRTKARRVLMLLDCCESGEGPRRVLQTWADTQQIDDTLHTASGGGRMMIAAANPLQFASESSSVSGHGLLSAALIDVLTKAEEPVDVRVLAAAISERVRAEAARLGEEQTPVDVSVMAGGFSLPALRRGNRYRAAFPEQSTAAAATFADLTLFGIAKGVTEVWNRDYPKGLNDLQLKSVNECRLLDGENLLAIAPTGSGKTLLGEMAALRAVSRGRRAVFLVPLRALASEKHEEFEERYGAALGLRVIKCTGDKTDQVPQFVRGKYDFALLTYEMFLNLLLSHPRGLLHVGTLVVDEAHFITDAERGITVELLMTLLVAARSQGTAPQLVALSAVIGKVNHFDEWLGARCLVSTDRPVPLVEGVIDRSGVFQYVDIDGAEKHTQLLRAHEVVQRKDKPNAQDVIVPLARRILADRSETLLIFRSKKGSAAGCAGYLGGELGLPAAAGALASLPAVAASSESDRLRQCLGGGTAFHNSNLIREERAAVERAFRDARELRVLAATTTVAAGVNTPATTVLIVDHEFFDREYTVAEYKNMAGRAGRPGFAAIGRSILYAETGIEREHLFSKYVKGVPDGVRSSFDPSKLDTWLIRLLRQVPEGIEADRVVGLLANTFGGYSLVRRDPAWKGRMQFDLARRLERMRQLRLVEDHRGRLVLTPLGEACGQSSLSLDSCMHLVEVLRRRGMRTIEDLMILVQCLEEADVYTPLGRANRKGTDRGWPHHLASMVRRDLVSELAHGGGTDGYEKRCKRSLVLLDWVRGRPMTEIEQHFTANPFFAVELGTVRSFADTARFHLRSAADIARAMFDSQPFPDEQLAICLEQLEKGLPARLLELSREVPLLTREEGLAMGRAGIASVTEITKATDEALLAILQDAARVKALRKALGLGAAPVAA